MIIQKGDRVSDLTNVANSIVSGVINVSTSETSLPEHDCVGVIIQNTGANTVVVNDSIKLSSGAMLNIPVSKSSLIRVKTETLTSQIAYLILAI